MSDSPIVTLRGQRSDDWDSLFSLMNHPGVLRVTGDFPYVSDDTFRDRYINAVQGQHRVIGEILLPSGRNRFVGVARVQVGQGRRRHHGQLEFLVHPDYQRSDAEESFLSQVIDFCRRWLALHRVQVVVRVDDTDRVALYEKYGFAVEMTMHQYVFTGGAYRDACLMAWLASSRSGDAVRESKPTPRKRKAAREPLEGLIVRGIESADWEDMAEILACDNVVANTLQLPYLSRDFVRERLENLADDRHMLAAEFDERVIGVLGIHFGAERQSHAVRLGMMVHEDYQGRGVGTALMQAAIDLCERWHNVRRIALEVFPDNAAGIALYKKLGFEIEGTMRDFAFRAGEYIDSYCMARVRKDDTQ